MYKLGAFTCLFVVMMVGACGCSTVASGNGSIPGTTPTLPATYIAGESTPPVESLAVTPIPTIQNASVNIFGSQTNITINGTNIVCNGGTCSSISNATSNTTSSNPTAPVSSFSADPVEAYVPPGSPNPNVSVQFTDTSTNSPTSWLWTFGDQSHHVSTAENPNFTYYGYNYYQVGLEATNSYGQSQSTAAIDICPLVVSFTATPTTGLVPVTVRFFDASSDQPIAWLWNFGDGSTSTLQNPTHTYTTSGVQTVRLDATNRWGKCWDTSEITVSPLVALFTPNQTSGLVPLTIKFTDTSTDQPISWNWIFGDGGTSNLQNPVYTYMNAGVYTAYLNATNGYDGWKSAPPTTITVYSLPLVSFTASPTSGMANTSVKFDDQSTGFPSPTSWYWDFGDGYNSTFQNPSHQYTISGLYTVSHSATNTQGTVWLNKTAYISIS